MESKYIYLIIGIVVLILLIVLFYYYYLLPNQTNVALYKIPLITDEQVFDETYLNTIILKPKVKNRDTLYVPNLGFGISFVWEMYIPTLNSNDNWQTNYNRLKPIISISDSPVIAYHPKNNYLSVVLKYRNNPFYAQFVDLKFNDIKLQRWSKYILIIENRNVKLYIDGKLVSVKTLPSVPVIYDIADNVVLGNLNNNFQGKVRNASLYPYPLNYTDVDLV